MNRWQSPLAESWQGLLAVRGPSFSQFFVRPVMYKSGQETFVEEVWKTSSEIPYWKWGDEARSVKNDELRISVEYNINGYDLYFSSQSNWWKNSKFENTYLLILPIQNMLDISCCRSNPDATLVCQRKMTLELSNGCKLKIQWRKQLNSYRCFGWKSMRFSLCIIVRRQSSARRTNRDKFSIPAPHDRPKRGKRIAINCEETQHVSIFRFYVSLAYEKPHTGESLRSAVKTIRRVSKLQSSICKDCCNNAVIRLAILFSGSVRIHSGAD